MSGRRAADLHEWVAPYVELEGVIELILSAIRDSATADTMVAEGGFYQQALDTRQSTQLLRVGVDAEASIYPEISAGKHRYSIRYMQPASQDSVPSQVNRNVEFLLSRCVL